MRYFVFTLVLSLVVLNVALSQDYAVQVAAYSDPVQSMDRFESLPGVYEEPDHNNIFRYYLGPYVTEDFAEKVRQKALKAGFQYARVVNLTQIRELCKRSCASPEDAVFTGGGETTPAPENDLFIRNIFFDFDRSGLKTESISQLDKLASILKDNPAYHAELHAHTDAIGSEEYNITLSKRRGEKTKAYLVLKGINASKLDVQVYGEDRPVAKNAVGNNDSPEGRKLNRRIEIRIVAADGQIIWDLVEAIAVPEYLKVD
jgi:outer membrane protein OmpA-like peptidoglycan-associated protein